MVLGVASTAHAVYTLFWSLLVHPTQSLALVPVLYLPIAHRLQAWMAGAAPTMAVPVGLSVPAPHMAHPGFVVVVPLHCADTPYPALHAVLPARLCPSHGLISLWPPFASL